MYTKIDNATEYLKNYIKIVPDVALVINTGLASITKEMNVPVEIPLSSIPGFSQTNNPQSERKLVYGILEGKYVLVMSGHPHYYEGFTNDELSFPFRVFANLGIKNVVFGNAAGAINENLKVGDLVLIKDHISLFAPNYLIGKNYGRFGPRLIDSSNIYNARLRNLILEKVNGDKENPKIKEGIYCFSSGPSYETISDIKVLKLLGADLVGMSLVPEATLCHQCGMNVISLTVITNRATGFNERPLSHREVILNVRINSAKQKSVIKDIIKLIPKE